MYLRFQNTKLALFFAVVLSVLAFVFAACGDDDANETTTVMITGFSPATGTPGTVVTISGAGFGTSGNDVKFNGKAAVVSNATADKLTVTVPVDATSGKITVAVNGQTATSAADFTVTMPKPAPTIVSFSPASGIVGDVLSIIGTNFSSTLSDVAVTINGSTAAVETVSATEIRVTVPSDANTGKVTVAINGAAATSAETFTILAPTITSFTPTIGAEHVSIVIMGTNFCEILDKNIVKFNGTAGTVTSATSTELTVTMPASTTTGKLSVQVGPNTATSTQDLTVCNLPELLVAKFEMVDIGANNKECSYKVTILNAGGQPLDMTKWVLQTYVAQNADGSNTSASGGTQLDAIGTLQSGQSNEYFNSSNTFSTFATYPYLVLNFHLKTPGTVTECNTDNNTVVFPIVK